MVKNPLVFSHFNELLHQKLQKHVVFVYFWEKRAGEYWGRFRLDKMHLDSHFERRNSTFLLSAFTKTTSFIDPNGCRKAFRRGEIVIFDAMFACGRLPAQASSQQQRQPAVSNELIVATASRQQQPAANDSPQPTAGS